MDYSAQEEDPWGPVPARQTPLLWPNAPGGAAAGGASGATGAEGGYVRVREGVVRQWRRIFQEQALKDVEVLLQDEERVMADSLVLRLASPVFDAMLTHEMQERRTMTLRLGDCTGPEFRFFLRLLYTGQMDPADWPPEEEPAETPTQPQQQQPFRYLVSAQQPPYRGRGKGWQQPPAAPLYQMRPAQGVLPAAAVPPGHPAAPPPPSAPPPPLGLLLAATGLAKKYQVDWLLCVLVDVVKKRVTEATFDSILSAAIRLDLGPIRLVALDFARNHQGIRDRYDSGAFPPNLAFELQAVFPLPLRSADGAEPVDVSI